MSQDWSAKLEGYFASYWSHVWLPYKGFQNQIKVLREPQMKHNVTQLEGKNEPVNSVLGNYFLELEPRNYKVEESNDTLDTQSGLLQFSWADNIDCNIVDLVLDVYSSSNSVGKENKFWILYFDGSKTLEGSGAHCVLMDPKKKIFPFL